MRRVNLRSFLDFDRCGPYVAHTLTPSASEPFEMTGLAALVQGLAGRSGVEAVLLVSHDGLPIQHAASAPVEPETVAALAATVGQHAGRLGQGAERGELLTAVLEYSNGLLVLARLGDGDWLALLTRPDADIGGLLYDLRQHRPAITSLL